MNLLFPVSVSLSTVAATVMVAHAVSPGASDFAAASLTFLGTLMILAVIEHWFLVLPLPVTAPWRWALSSRKGARRGHPRGEGRLAALAPCRVGPAVAEPGERAGAGGRLAPLETYAPFVSGSW